MKSISSIPTYNDEETIEKLVEGCKNVLDKITNDYEIVVINNGSRDKTYETLEKLKGGNIKVFHHGKNTEFGKTMKEVFTFPTKEWIFFIASDVQIYPSEIKKFISFFEKYDYILGFRKKIRHFY